MRGTGPGFRRKGKVQHTIKMKAVQTKKIYAEKQKKTNEKHRLVKFYPHASTEMRVVRENLIECVGRNKQQLQKTHLK